MRRRSELKYETKSAKEGNRNIEGQSVRREKYQCPRQNPILTSGWVEAESCSGPEDSLRLLAKWLVRRYLDGGGLHEKRASAV